MAQVTDYDDWQAFIRDFPTVDHTMDTETFALVRLGRRVMTVHHADGTPFCGRFSGNDHIFDD